MAGAIGGTSGDTVVTRGMNVDGVRSDMVVRGTGDGSGLNPARQRGFGGAPSLSDLKARQGAIVARFMTFFQRKTSLVIELYNTVFYKQKPSWDKIADFVHNDLCSTVEQRRAIKVR